MYDCALGKYLKALLTVSYRLIATQMSLEIRWGISAMLNECTLCISPLTVSYEPRTKYDSSTRSSIIQDVCQALNIKQEKVACVYNPDKDGNCGFRVISMALCNDHTRWQEVKAQILQIYIYIYNIKIHCTQTGWMIVTALKKVCHVTYLHVLQIIGSTPLITHKL